MNTSTIHGPLFPRMLLKITASSADKARSFVDELRLGFDNPHPRDYLGEPMYTKFVTVTLCHIQESTCGLDERTKKVYKFVLCDGNFDFFVAAMSSGLSTMIEQERPPLGAAITIREYRVVRCIQDEGDKSKKRGVVFVTRFTWKLPPNLDAAACPADDPKQSGCFYVDRALIDEALKTKLFILSQTHFSGNVSYMAPMGQTCLDGHDNNLRASYSLRNMAIPADKLQMDGQGDSKCDCTMKFEFAKCLVSVVPVSRVDKFDLWMEAKEILGWSTSPLSFDDLVPMNKKWWLYWWYTINFLGDESRPLPLCLVSHVEASFPER